MAKNYPKNWIRELRKSRDMSPAELGEKIGISGTYVSMLESGTRRLYQDWVTKIAAVLECHPSEITEGPGGMMVARNDIERNILAVVRGMADHGQTVYAIAKSLAAEQKKPMQEENPTPSQESDHVQD